MEEAKLHFNQCLSQLMGQNNASDNTFFYCSSLSTTLTSLSRSVHSGMIRTAFVSLGVLVSGLLHYKELKVNIHQFNNNLFTKSIVLALSLMP